MSSNIQYSCGFKMIMEFVTDDIAGADVITSGKGTNRTNLEEAKTLIENSKGSVEVSDLKQHVVDNAEEIFEMASTSEFENEDLNKVISKIIFPSWAQKLIEEKMGTDGLENVKFKMEPGTTEI